MKLRELKKWINKLNENQLDRELYYNSKDLSISGRVTSVSFSPSDLLNPGDDDPCPLYSRKQLKEQGYSNEDIDEMDIEIVKGDLIVTF